MTQALATVDHSSRAHARFSPSSLAYREMCPHWTSESEEGKDTTAADIGTKLHEAVETGDLSKLEDHEKTLAQMCIDYIESVKAEHPGCKHHKEIRLAILDQYGTADHVILYNSASDLMDTKFGWLKVTDAESNVQLMAYALGVWDKHPEVEGITVHILQPRLGQISVHTFTRKADYERIKLRIWTIIERAKNPTEYNPSTIACEYCGNRAKCQALANAALMVAKGNGLDIPENTGPLTISNPADMNKLLKVAPILEKWAKDIKQAALDMHLDEGWEYDDFKLAARSTNRTVTSTLAAWDVLKDEISLEDFISACGSVSVVELEKVFSAKAPRGKKASEAARLENLLRDAGALKEQGEITYLKQVKNKAK